MYPGRKAKISKGSSKLCATASFSISTCSSEDDDNGTIRETAAVLKVFHIEMIREKILNYAIHDKKGNISTEMVKTVRLVEKRWLETTSKLLQKSAQSVVKLTFIKTNSLNTSVEVKTKGKLLDRLVERFTGPSKMDQSFLPFKLVLKLDYFRKENYESLVDCFRRLGNELVELEMTYPIVGGTMPPLKFPRLRQVSFQFSDGGMLQRQAKKTNFGDNESGFWLLQSLISGCKSLKRLNIWNTNDSLDFVPKSIQFLHLPDTISCMTLGLDLKSKELEAIVFQLSHLKHLTIQTHSIPFENEFLYKILERVQKTLVTFQVEGAWCTGIPGPNTYLRFPRMEKLKTIIIDSLECVLAPVDVQEFRDNLPNLNRADIVYQTEPMLSKWLQYLSGPNVESLYICVVDEQLDCRHDNFFKSISLQIMKRVDLGFPNLKAFTLDLNIDDLTTLKYLFKKMNYLQTLDIHLHGNLNGSVLPQLNSVFLGLPLEVVNALNYFETFVLKDNQQPCIRNLSKLKELSLWTTFDTEAEQTSLLSDLLFNHGFLKMPELHNLSFHGKFKPSPKIKKEWEDRGGQLEYSAEWKYGEICEICNEL